MHHFYGEIFLSLLFLKSTPFILELKFQALIGVPLKTQKNKIQGLFFRVLRGLNYGYIWLHEL